MSDTTFTEIIASLPITEEEKQAWVTRFDREGMSPEFVHDFFAMLAAGRDAASSQLEAAMQATPELQSAYAAYLEEMDDVERNYDATMAAVEQETDALEGEVFGIVDGLDADVLRDELSASDQEGE